MPSKPCQVGIEGQGFEQVERQFQAVGFFRIQIQADIVFFRQQQQLLQARQQFAHHARVLRPRIARMQSRQLDRDAGAVLDAAPVGRRADRMDRILIRREIVGGVVFCQRRFAQHVVGIAITARLVGAAVFQRFDYGLAGDELIAQHAHGQVHSLADQRFAAFGNQLGHRRAQTLFAAGADQLAGNQQAPGGGIDEERRRLAQVAAPVALADLVGDQAVGSLMVGNAQQRFGQAHQGHALFRRQRKFVHQGIDAGSPRSLAAHRFDQTAC